jgi:hypothetical protein
MFWGLDILIHVSASIMGVSVGKLKKRNFQPAITCVMIFALRLEGEGLNWTVRQGPSKTASFGRQSSPLWRDVASRCHLTSLRQAHLQEPFCKAFLSMLDLFPETFPRVGGGGRGIKHWRRRFLVTHSAVMYLSAIC